MSVLRGIHARSQSMTFEAFGQLELKFTLSQLFIYLKIDIKYKTVF
jgi:hypothetical protein